MLRVSGMDAQTNRVNRPVRSSGLGGSCDNPKMIFADLFESASRIQATKLDLVIASNQPTGA